MTREFKRAARAPLLSVRLTHEERATLKQAAGDLPLSTYARDRLFSDDCSEAACATRLSALERQKMLSKLLMRIGALNLEARLSDLTAQLNTGAFENERTILDELEQLQSEVTALRLDLLRALGLRPDRGSP